MYVHVYFFLELPHTKTLMPLSLFQEDNKLQADPQLSSFFSRNWGTARECLNDVFSPDNTGMSAQERQAAISEFRGVWMGRTDLSQASAQVRLSWQVIRDCVDRFVNRNSPNTAQAMWRSFCELIYLHIHSTRIPTHTCTCTLYIQ